MQVTAKPTVVIAPFDSEKLRSRKRCSGSSGSFLLSACQTTNSASSTTPEMIRPHTVIGPVMTPQS